ncbi:hypothetical protein PENTCL1PPCAC_16257, partial [Pristionchus entomophagus]
LPPSRMWDNLITGFLSFAHVIHFPTVDEINQDFAMWEYEVEQGILKTSFQRVAAADQVQLEAHRFRVKIGAHIDHVENLDEQAESVDVHGSLHFRWTNPLFTWNSSANHNLTRISRTVKEFHPFLPWTPRPEFPWSVQLGRENIKPGEYDKLQYQEASQLSVFNDGSMILSVPFSLRITCNFIFTPFPNDEHKCILLVKTEHALDIYFDKDDVIMDLWSTSPNRRYTEFVYKLHTSRLNAYVVCTPNACDNFLRMSVFNVDIAFTRDTWRYFWLLNLPLLLFLVATQYSLFADAKYAFFLLTLVTFLFMRQLAILRQSMPASSDGIPLIGIMYMLTFVQIFGVFFTRSLLLWLSRHLKRRKTTSITVPVLKRSVEIECFASRIMYSFISILTAVIVLGTLVIQSR